LEYTFGDEPIRVSDLQIEGAVTALLKDAIKPNLVQTLENTPAIIHGGPFANIAHGCNSIIATKFALKLADYVITEAGFGADLGAEKFLDIKCPTANIKPSAIVIVATIRALKYNGGIEKGELNTPNAKAVEAGIGNLEKHVENMKKYNVPVVVAINKFGNDTEEELQVIIDSCAKFGVEVVESDVFANGGAGGVKLAEKIVELCEKPSEFKPLYDKDMPIDKKIEKVAKEIYGADGVDFLAPAVKKLHKIEKLGMSDFRVCMAKTQYSLSDDPTKLGRPRGFRITVRDINISAGAGFVVALTGDIMTMPGLTKKPAALRIDVSSEGKIEGLF
jgi:formate--tetrahydrofolate ligase